MIKLFIKETPEERFYYHDFGDEGHGRSSFRLWVHPSLVAWDKDTPYLDIPKQGVALSQGKKPSTRILRPGTDNLFDVYVPCGYRGRADFTIKTPHKDKVYYLVYRSPQGNLGVSVGALVVTDQESVTYQWRRTGRLYGDPPEGFTTINLDGEVSQVEGVESLDELKDLAERRTEK